jgi:hypothetical protein
VASIGQQPSGQWLDATKAATVLHEVGSEPIAGAIVIKTH